MNESTASPDADSSTFGHPEGVVDTEPSPVLGKTHRNAPSLDEVLSVVLAEGEGKQMEGRGLYRVVFAILLVVLGLLLDARRLGDAAALILL